MNYIETHAHIYDEKFDEDRAEMLFRAKDAGIQQIWMPNCNVETIEPMLALAQAFPHFCLPMMGLHPCYVDKHFEKQLQRVETELSRGYPYLAIGEIGLDLYWDNSFFKQQQEAFLIQCQWAQKYDLWIDIHTRMAFNETLELIEKNADPNLRGIFHCFTGTLAEAQKVIELGFLLGIGGVVTYKNGGLDQVLPYLDLAHIVLETDSPYLAPTPYRGKRNEPAMLQPIAERVALLMGKSLAQVLEATTQNAKRLHRSVAVDK
jgi:TatD DNase family protein